MVFCILNNWLEVRHHLAEDTTRQRAREGLRLAQIYPTRSE